MVVVLSTGTSLTCAFELFAQLIGTQITVLGAVA